MTTDQYKQSGPSVIKANVKSAEVKRQESVEASIKELNERITTQYKLIDKLVRDMKRIKDQISELAGRIPRG